MKAKVTAVPPAMTAPGDIGGSSVSGGRLVLDTSAGVVVVVDGGRAVVFTEVEGVVVGAVAVVINGTNVVLDGSLLGWW